MDFSSITATIKDKITSISAYNMGLEEEVHDNAFEAGEDSVSPIFLTPHMPNDEGTPTFLMDRTTDSFIVDSNTDSNTDSTYETAYGSTGNVAGDSTNDVLGSEEVANSLSSQTVPSYPILTPYISDLKPVLLSAISNQSNKRLKKSSVSFLNADASVFTKMFGCGCAGALSDDGVSSPTSPCDILDSGLGSGRAMGGATQGCFNITAEEYLIQSEIWVEEKKEATKAQIMEMHANVTEVMAVILDRCRDLTQKQREMLQDRLVSLHSDVSARLTAYSAEAFALLPYSSMEEAFEGSIVFCKGAGEALNEAVSDFVRTVHRQLLMLDIPSKVEKHHCIISGKVASMAMLVRDMMQEQIVDEAKRMIAESASNLREHKAYLTIKAVSAANSACDIISDSLSPTRVRKVLDDCIDRVMETVCDRLDEMWGKGKVTFEKMMNDLKTGLEEFVINSPESLHRSPRDFSLVRYEE